MKKKFFIDNYIKQIKDDKLEIIDTLLTINNYQETITNPKKEKIKIYQEENEEKVDNNNYVELNCREKIPKLKTLKINNQFIIQINSKVYTYLNNLKSLDLCHNAIATISKKIINIIIK